MRYTQSVTSAVGILFAIVTLALPTSVQAQKQRGDRNRITKEELAETPATVSTAYDVVRTMRPQWLSPPIGRTSSSNVMGDGGGAKDVVLYVDDVRQPSLDDLRTVKSNILVELRFLEQNRAIQMRGPGHEMGVIEVTTVIGKKK